MSITPQMINEQGFEHALRGYDTKQVDDFLEYVAREIGELLEKNYDLGEKLENTLKELQNVPEIEDKTPELEQAYKRIESLEAQVKDLEEKQTNQVQEDADPALLMQARAKIAELEKKLKDKTTDDEVISKAFISAQRSADALKEDARAEGERIYRESEAKARELLRDALIEKQRVLNEAEGIKQSYDKFRDEFKAMITHFGSEAEKTLASVKTPEISEAAVDGLLAKQHDEVKEISEASKKDEEKAVISEDKNKNHVAAHQSFNHEVARDNAFFDDIEEIN